MLEDEFGTEPYFHTFRAILARVRGDLASLRSAVEYSRQAVELMPDVPAVVIGSDTIVILDSDVLGKPRDAADAIRMLRRLSGREHEVFTGVALVAGAGTFSAIERVRVRFRTLDRSECEAYVATGEPLDKAGAYGIQGYGSALVESIIGDYFAVMGLPIVQTLRLLRLAGWSYAFGEGLQPLPRPEPPHRPSQS